MTEIERIAEALRQNLKALNSLSVVKEATPQRVVSRSAKTVQCGMLMEFPEAGWQTVTGHSLVDGHAVISSIRGAVFSAPVGERVRTRNG